MGKFYNRVLAWLLAVLFVLPAGIRVARAQANDSLMHHLQRVELAHGAERIEKARALVDSLEYVAGEDYLTDQFTRDERYALIIAQYAVAECLQDESDFVESSKLCMRFLPGLCASGDSLRMFDALQMQGVNYMRMGAYEDALQVALQSDSIATALRDSSLMGASLSNLGSLYLSMRKAQEAATYYERAVEISRAISAPEDHSALARRLSNLAEAYNVAGEGQKALEAAKESLSYEQAEGREGRLAVRYCVLGDAYAVLGRYEEAERSYAEALPRLKEQNNAVSYAITLKQMGGLRYKQGRYAEANEYLMRALRVAKVHDLALIQERSLMLLYQSNRERDPKLALKYFEEYNSLRDSIQQEDTKRQMNLLYARYETELKEQKIRLQELELESARVAKTRLEVGFLSTVVISVLLVVLLLQKREKAKLLRELNETKNKFFSIISHDTKSIASSIKMVLNQMLGSYGELPDEVKLEMVKELSAAADVQMDLLNNLLRWAHLQMNSDKFEPEEFDLVAMAQHNLDIASFPLSKKGITVQASLPASCMVYADRNMIATILRNLMTNAIKFSNPSGQIEVSLEDHPAGVVYTIRDFGMGMSAEQVQNLGRIDKRVVRLGTQGEQGSGLGMILCFNMAKRNGAKLQVESKPKQGTRITLTLPQPVGLGSGSATSETK